MRRTSFFAAVFAISAGCSIAQQQPQLPTYDAGALMRQTEQNIRQTQLQQAAKQRATLAPAAVLTESTVVTAERFKFNGNQRLSTEQLQAVAAPFANRSLNQQDLQHLTDAVSQEYRKTGWLVRAYIPSQNLAGPELTVQVVESIPPIKP
jgi:hemolysin activation/secretion protein